MSLSGPHTATAVELKARLEMESDGAPFLILRDDAGVQRLVSLAAITSVTIGRDAACDISLAWDDQVSRIHAELRRVGGGWALDDGGLSRNGSFVNGRRVQERQRLHDGDTLRFGRTLALFRAPAAAADQAETARAVDGGRPPDLSSGQRAVLLALSRPFASGAPYPKPATNAEIAQELYLSVDAVKGHLRVLFSKFELEALPQNEKRLRLAERGLSSGAISLAELRRS